MKSITCKSSIWSIIYSMNNIRSRSRTDIIRQKSSMNFCISMNSIMNRSNSNTISSTDSASN